MSPFSYRRLDAEQAPLLGSIDRSEQIDGIYRVHDDELRLEPASIEVVGWQARELEAYVSRLVTLLAAGGVVIGAWHGSALAGLASLDVAPLDGDGKLLKLDMLYVDRAFRRRGIARELVWQLANEARSRGATALYVSATPSRGTVDSYLRLGAQLARPADPALLRLEPEDIHLWLPLTKAGGQG